MPGVAAREHDSRVGEAGVPALTGVSHIDLSVSDRMVSARWYESVLGFEMRGERFNESAGLLWVHLIHPSSGVSVGLVEHPDNSGERFDERRCGLDHLSLAVAGREDLEAIARRLGELGIQVHIVDSDVASVIVLRDPDNIQLELCAWA